MMAWFPAFPANLTKIIAGGTQRINIALAGRQCRRIDCDERVERPVQPRDVFFRIKPRLWARKTASARLSTASFTKMFFDV
jgi:hypothetical protein